MYFVILGNILVHQNWQKANLNTLGHIWAVRKIRPKHVSSETIKINYSPICGWLPYSLLNILVSTPGSGPPCEMMILNPLCSTPERPCAWLRPMKCRQTRQTLLLSRGSQSSAMPPRPATTSKRTWKRKSLSRVRLLVTPWTIPPMEFSRPEYWSGLPFLSPGDLPNPGIEPRSPALQVDSLPDEPQEKPKNAGLGSLSLLQRFFLTQGLNWGLLHCRRILYQLSHLNQRILLQPEVWSKEHGVKITWNRAPNNSR